MITGVIEPSELVCKLLPQTSEVVLVARMFVSCRKDLPLDQDKNDLLESNLNIDDLPAEEELQVKIVMVNWCGKVTTRIPRSRQEK